MLSLPPDPYVPVTPVRVLDARLMAGATVTVDTQVPAATAVAVQITGSGTAGPGYVSAWIAGGPRPDSSVLNLRGAGDVDTNYVIVPVDGGRFELFASEGADITVDAVGYVAGSADIAPRRVVDTRLTGGTPAGTAITVPTGLPAGTRCAAVQLTVADTAGPGFLAAWSGRSRRPDSSVLNYRAAGDVGSNFVIVPLAPDGTFRIFTLEQAGIIVDLFGAPTWYTPVGPQRVLDTRNSGGTPAASVLRVHTNLNPTVTTAAVQITVVDADGPGPVTAWDGTAPMPDVPAVRAVSAGFTGGKFTIVPVREGTLSVHTSVSAGLVVDVMGYTGLAANVSYDIPDPNPSTRLPDDVAIAAPDTTFRYGTDRLQALDVHRGVTGRTLVWFHGGGWESGDKSLQQNGDSATFNRVPRLLHRDGWTVISVNYRLSPRARLEDIVDDVHASLMAVKRRARSWNVDLTRLVVGGFSAGAHIAGLAVTAADGRTFRPPQGLPTVRAILAQDGNMMTSLFAAAVPAGDPSSPAPAIARLLGCPGGTFANCSADRIAKADLATYSGPADPPLYLIAATHSIIPFEVQTQTRDLVRARGQVVVFDGVDTGPESGRLHDVLGMNWAALRTFLETVTA